MCVFLLYIPGKHNESTIILRQLENAGFRGIFANARKKAPNSHSNEGKKAESFKAAFQAA